MATPDMKVTIATNKNSSGTVSVSGSVQTDNEVAALHSALNAASELGGSSNSFLFFGFKAHADGSSDVQLLTNKQ